jgi:hypothetical protein
VLAYSDVDFGSTYVCVTETAGAASYDHGWLTMRATAQTDVSTWCDVHKHEPNGISLPGRRQTKRSAAKLWRRSPSPWKTRAGLHLFALQNRFCCIPVQIAEEPQKKAAEIGACPITMLLLLIKQSLSPLC